MTRPHALPALLALAAAVATPLPAAAAPPACGTTITANLTLDGNMNCPSGHAIIIGANGITLDGGGFTIVSSTGNGVYAGNNSNVTVRNLVIDGSSTADGISMSGANNLVRSVTVRNRRYGIYLNGGTGNAIEQSTVTGARDYSFIIQGPNPAFRNNSASAGQSAGTYHYYVVASGSLVFTGNRAEGVGSGIRYDSSSGVTFDNASAGNVFTGLTGHGLYGTSTTNVTISNWTLAGPNGNYGVYLHGSGGRVTGVNASNFQYGIWVAGSNHTVDGNVAGNNTDAGLRFGETGLVVRDNNFSGNRAYSVYTGAYTGTLSFLRNDLRGSPRALQVDNTTGLTLDNTSAGNLVGSNIVCGFCGSSDANFVMRGWDFSGAGRSGFGVAFSGSVLTLDNVTADDRDTGFALAGDQFTVTNVRARRANWAVQFSNTTTSSISGSDLTAAASSAIRVSNVSGTLTMSGNDFRNSARAIYMDSARDVVFDNAATGITPNLLGTHAANAIEGYNATRVTVQNWNFPGSGGNTGVYLQATQSVVQNVVATGRSGGAVVNGTANVIRGCSFTNSTSYNLILYGSDATIENNVLTGGSGSALRFETYTGGAVLRGNDLRNASIGILLNGARDLVIEPPSSGSQNVFGNNATAVQATSNSTNVVVRNLDLSGGGTGFGVYSDAVNTTVENVVANGRQNGIYLTNSGSTVRGCTVRNAIERGLHVRRGGAVIVGNAFTGAGSSGINFYDYAGAVQLENNDLRGSAWAMYIEFARGLVLDNAPAGGIPNLVGSNTSGGVGGTGDTVVVKNWNFTGGGSGYGVTIDGVNGTALNVVASERLTGIRFGGRGATITGCTIQNAREDAIIAYQPTITITNNVLTGAGRSAVYFYYYSGAAVLSGNDFTGSARGLLLSSVLDLAVDQTGASGTANTFSNNSVCAICGDGSGLTFTGVDASGRGLGYGIQVTGNNVIIRGATVKARATGIALSGASNRVETTLVRDNTTGIDLAGTAPTVANSRLCWNSTAGLTYNGSDATEAGGNFWGNTTGPRIAANPGGTGNAITGNGRVNWSPFLTEGTGCESNLAVRQLELTSLVDAVAGTVQSVRVRALDRYGAVVDGYAGIVAFVSNDAAAVLPAASTLTAGVRTAPVTLKTAGTRTLTAYDTASPDLTTTVTVQVLPNPGAARLTRLSGDAQTGTAGAALPLPLRVKLDDVYGNVLTGRDVAFAALTGGGSVAAPTATTDASGIATVVALSGTTAGTNTYAASYTGATGSPIGFTATGVPGDVARLEFTGLPATLVAGTSATVQVRARDQHDNLVTAYTGPVQFSSTDPAALFPGTSSLTSGAGTFDVTFKTAGTQLVSVADTRYIGFRSSQVTTVTAAAASRLFLVSGNAQVAEAGTAAPDPLVVGAADRFGNAVAGVMVTFAAGSDGAVLPSTATTAANGTASSVATVSTHEGATDFTASASGLTGSPVRFQLLSRAGPASTLVYVSGGGLSGRVSQQLLAPLVVMTADRYGNRVGNSPVTFRAITAGASVSPTTVTSDTAGLAQSFATLGPGAGLQQFEARGATNSATVRFDETAVGGDASGLRLLDGENQSGTVGSDLALPLRVIVEDSHGNPVPRVAVGFTTTAATASVAPAFVVTDAAGIATATANPGHVAGAVTFTATSPGLANSPITFHATARPGPATSLVYVSGDAQAATVGHTLTQPLVARSTDAYGNAVGGLAVTFATTDGSVAPASVTTGEDGLASAQATLGNAAGTQHFTASTADGASIVEFHATAAPDSPASFTVLDGDAQTGPAGRALEHPLRVVVKDANGNAIPGLSIDFAATTDGASVSPTTAVSDASGVAATTLTLPRSPGPATLTAALDVETSLPPLEASATAVAGPATHFRVEGVPSPVAAGTATGATATALDAFDNVATTYTGPAHAVSSDAHATLPTGVVFTDGVATLSVAFQSAGTQTVGLVDDADASITGTQVGIVVTAAPDLTVVVSTPDGTTVVGGSVRVQLQLVDGFGNPVDGARVVQVSADGDASLTGTTLREASGLGTGSVSGLTDALGRASITLTTLTAGDVTITGSGDGIGAGTGVARFVPATADRLVAKPRAATSALACDCLGVEVVLADPYGNAVGNALSGVTFEVSGTATIRETTLAAATGTLPGAKVTGRLDGHGGATARICGQQAERVTFTASHPQLPGRAGTVELDFALGELSPTLSTFVPDVTRVQTRTGHATLTLVPKDECGNDLGPGLDVSIATTTGRLGTITDVGDGTYSAEFSVIECPEPASATLSAKVANTDVASPITLEIACIPLSPEKSTVTFTRTDAARCDDPTKATIGVTVSARDENGARLATGTSVAIEMDGQDGGTFTENADGDYVAELGATACSDEARAVKVTVNGTDLQKDGLALTFHCPTIDVAHSSVDVERTEIRADGLDATKLTVKAMTECEEPARGRPVKFELTVGTVAAAETLDETGTVVGELTSKQEGLDTVKVTVDGTELGTKEVRYRAAVRYGGGFASCGCTGMDPGSVGLLALASLVRRRRRHA